MSLDGNPVEEPLFVPWLTLSCDKMVVEVDVKKLLVNALVGRIRNLRTFPLVIGFLRGVGDSPNLP